MIKWLKRKIDIHNEHCSGYADWEDIWYFSDWVVAFIATIVLSISSGILISLKENNWGYLIGCSSVGVLIILWLCWQVELFSKSDTENYNEEEFDPYRINNIQFIWGIKSWDDLTSSEANMYTMNDLELTYDKDTELYSLNIETIYHFDKGKIEEVNYLNCLLKEFTKYMEENNYDINVHFPFQCEQPQTTLRAKTIPELYTQFRIFVEGYNVVYGGVENETVYNI